jgi:hypothetical protein
MSRTHLGCYNHEAVSQSFSDITEDSKKTLFYISGSNETPMQLKLNLTEYSGCKVSGGERNTGKQKEAFSTPEKIELVLIPLNKNEREVSLGLCNKQFENPTRRGE